MANFGFTIFQPRVIDLDNIDVAPSDALFSCEEALRACIGCGACVGGCTAGSLTQFNFRRLHTHIRRGELKDVKEEVDKCMLCGRCSLVCPRGINTRNVIVSIKKIFNEPIL